MLAQSKAASSSDFKTLSAKADAARDANRLDEAVVLYKKALALRSGWTEGWWSLGTLLYDVDKYAQAAKAFRKVVQQNPRNGTAHVMLGLCEYELGTDDAALRELGTGRGLGVLKDEQLQRVLLYHQGILLLRKGKFAAAQESLFALMRSGTQSDEATLATGMAALLIKPPNLPKEGTAGREVVSRTGRAEALLAQRKFEEAEAAYKSLTEEYRDYPNIHYAYGRFLLEIHEVDAAVAEFQLEIKNNPNHVFARLQIAGAKYRLDSAAGLPYAEEAVKLNPQPPFGHYLLGLLYLDTGNFVNAIPELETAGRHFVNEPTVYFALGSAYARAGRKQDAARARATFVRLDRRANKQTAPDVYGESPSGVAPENLGAESDAKPPR